MFTQVGEPRRVRFAQVEHTIEPREDPLVGGKSGILRTSGDSGVDALIGVAEECGCIAVPSRKSSHVVKGVVEW